MRDVDDFDVEQVADAIEIIANLISDLTPREQSVVLGGLLCAVVLKGGGNKDWLMENLGRQYEMAEAMRDASAERKMRLS